MLHGMTDSVNLPRQTSPAALGLFLVMYEEESIQVAQVVSLEYDLQGLDWCEVHRVGLLER